MSNLSFDEDYPASDGGSSIGSRQGGADEEQGGEETPREQVNIATLRPSWDTHSQLLKNVLPYPSFRSVSSCETTSCDTCVWCVVRGVCGAEGP